jgi:hypothetical protein
MAEDTATTEEESTEAEGSEAGKGNVKVPEAFQQECAELVNGVKTLPELNFLSDLINEQRTELMKSQKKSKLTTDDFSTEGMPS